MKTYTNFLSEEKIKLLCQILSPASFKRFFRENPKFFSKIRPGFRANSLRDSEVISLVVKNIDETKLRSFVNESVQKVLERIESAKDNMADKDQATAIARALLESPFKDQVDLFFDLQHPKYSEGEISEIKEQMIKIKENEKYTEKVSGMGEAAKDSTYIKELEEKLQSSEEQREHDKEEYLQKVESLNVEKSSLEVELAELKKRVQYVDEEESDMIPIDYEHLSICEATEVDSQGNSWYYRLADIKSDGTIEAFLFDEELPWYFENRNRILIKDGFLNEGEVGVWGWSSTIRDTDPTKDYVSSKNFSDLMPTEIIILHDCSNMEDLVKKLKEGIIINSTSDKMLLCFQNVDREYTGLLCLNSSFDNTTSCPKLKSEIVELPRYSIKKRNTLRLSNGTLYVNNIFLGAPEKMEFVKDSFDVVRTIISNRNSWSMFKQKGKTRSEWKNVKEFLEQMDTVPLIQEIVDVLRCSAMEAEEVLKKFIEEAETYIDGNSVEDQVLQAIIAVNPDLLNHCKEIVREDWYKENRSEIEEATRHLEFVRQQKLSVEQDLKTEQDKVNKLQASLDQLQLIINDKRKLASDVEAEVRDRIVEAQKNVAKFIADMTFVPQSNVSIQTGVNNAGMDESLQYSEGTKIKQIKSEEAIDWKDELDTIEDNLIEAGVAVTYARPLAAYLYSAYLSPAHASIMLIGPNAEEIVDAFSSAITGNTADTLECEGTYNYKSVMKSQSCENKIVKIRNPFENHWLSRICSIVNTSNVFYMAVYPFMEDVQIEPKSVFNYFLPICTELLVDRCASQNYMGGNRAKSFREYPVKTAFRRNSKFNALLHIPQITGNRIQSVITNQHIMLGTDEKDSEHDMLFAYLPYANATMQMSTMLELLDDTEGRRSITSSELRRAVLNLYGKSE